MAMQLILSYVVVYHGDGGPASCASVTAVRQADTQLKKVTLYA